jgi:hypothetical protein
MGLPEFLKSITAQKNQSQFWNIDYILSLNIGRHHN